MDFFTSYDNAGLFLRRAVLVVTFTLNKAVVLDECYFSSFKINKYN
jgi:hypothetical protein